MSGPPPSLPPSLGPASYDDHDHVVGPFLHGTRAVLAPGDELVPGHPSHFRPDRPLAHVYVTTLEPTAAWGAQLAAALSGEEGPGRVYVVEPTGPIEDDPNVTDQRFPGNPTRSFRTQHPVRVVEELTGWVPHPPDAVEAMLASLARLRAEGTAVVLD